MHDKTIRRRRAVLVLLVVVSLALLTDYFGEKPSSPLHSIQRGIATVLSPLQSGASTVLSPVRDVAGYIGDTFKAKSELAHYKSVNATLTREFAQAQLQASQNRKAAALLGLDNNYGMKQYGPVTAEVIGRDPVLWYDTITVDRGSGAGVKLRDPVVGPNGLVGDVTSVGPGSATIQLITSPKFSVGAMIENHSGAPGLVQPRVGDPSTLNLIDLPTTSNVLPNELVVTSGIRWKQDPTIESFAPAGIPIGTVSGSNPQSSLLTSQEVQVTPLADLQHLSLVQILTRPHSG